MKNSQLLLHTRQTAEINAQWATKGAHCANDGYSKPDALIKEVDGLCAFDNLSIQLQLHANDTLERTSQSQRFDIPAQLTVMLLLEGDIQVTINQTSRRMSARNGPVGYLWFLAQPGTLVRHIRAGQRVRKVNITLPSDGVESLQLPQELRQHINLDAPGAKLVRWSPSPQALRCAQEILTQRGQADSMHTLQAYIAGLSMLQQALRITHQEARLRVPSTAQRITDRDMARAQKIRDRIVSNEDYRNATPQHLADALGMSVSTLQRLFKAAYGRSVVEFQRGERMNAVRAQMMTGAITVGEASYRAGYSTVSNFSSAFHRIFGYPPSACIRR